VQSVQRVERQYILQRDSQHSEKTITRYVSNAWRVGKSWNQEIFLIVMAIFSVKAVTPAQRVVLWDMGFGVVRLEWLGTMGMSHQK